MYEAETKKEEVKEKIPRAARVYFFTGSGIT